MFRRFYADESGSLGCPDAFTPPNISKKEVRNEPILQYLSCSCERTDLECFINRLSCPITDIPIVIGDEEIKMERAEYQYSPYDHQTKVARFYLADGETIKRAIRNCIQMQKVWDKFRWEDRIKIFQKAAELAAGPYRQKLNAATMIGQGKTVIQAEIDSACEFIDFLNFNCAYLVDILKYQPLSPEPEITKNFFRLRGCEGFWAAVTPFNFTAIGGNLASAPVLMGNSVLWKPCHTAMLSSWVMFEIFREAGLPPGVLNFCPADGPEFGDTITASPHLAGINFTGSTKVYNRLLTQVATNIESYRNYPRLIGELGGKNFHFVHPTAEVCTVINNTVRSAFEYSGQKCSACSIIYVPYCLYNDMKCQLIAMIDSLMICHPTQFNAFTSAVIDKAAFNRIASYIEFAKTCNELEILTGGCYDETIGYYIEPTLILCHNHNNKIMKEEIFGPVLTMYVYNEYEIDNVLEMIAKDAPYALTGAVFAQDPAFITQAMSMFKMCAGNFYVNDKCTGAVVGQQPFGGTRHSGTNDKSGGPYYLLRFANGQSIKQTFTPLCDYSYPYMCC